MSWKDAAVLTVKMALAAVVKKAKELKALVLKTLADLKTTVWE